MSIIPEYEFRTTYKQSDSVYIEDRGYPFFVKKDDENFETVNDKFNPIIKIGETASRNSQNTDQEEWDIVEGFYLIDQEKQKLLNQLDSIWKYVQDHIYVNSFLGYPIDATLRAVNDIEGLIVVSEATNSETVTFCDAANNYHEIGVNDLKKMKIEIIQQQQKLYADKWKIRTEIDENNNLEELIVLHKDIENLNSFVWNSSSN